jgi:phospholipid transport system transporter-binding protein
VSECRFAASAEGWVVSGALVLATAARAYADGVRLQQGHPAARLDLSGIDAIDSAGVAVLLAWVAAARQRGESLQVVGLPAAGAALARVGGVLELLSPSAS